MKLKAVSGMMLTLLFIGMLTLAFNIQPVKASGTIYIKADGSIDPPTANITSVDNITYYFTDNNYDKIVVERDNIVVDGAGYTLQGTGIGTGIDLSGRSNVTIKNIEIKAFHYGIYLDESSNNGICGNNITNNYLGIYLRESSNNSISGNNITANNRGIWLVRSANNTISGNTVTENNGYGIWLDGSANNTLRNNDASNNKYNFGVYGSGGYGRLSHYIEDIDDSNTANGKPIYYWVNRRDMTVPLDAGWIALVNCTRITVENLNLTNNWQGVLLAFTTSSTITKNNITNNYYGVHLYRSDYNTISGNIVRNNGGGIYVQYWCWVNTIAENNVSNNSFGIVVFRDSNYNTIAENNVRNNGYGIAVSYWSYGNTIAENNVSSNGDGIALSEAGGYKTGNNIVGNNVSNNYGGISLTHSAYNELRNNSMTENTVNFGVAAASLKDFLQDIDTSNTVNGKPIYYLINQRNLTIDPSTFPDIGYLKIVNSTNVVVKNLDFNTNNLLGVGLAYTTNSTIENVTASGNLVGIGLVYSHNNTIIGNMLTDNKEGIEFAYSDNNRITGNKVSNNSWYGILFYRSDDNTIYHNNLINNTRQASILESYGNVWDNGYPSGGNYWSDHVCTGNPSDGSQPYIIDADNIDHYPFQDPNGWLLHQLTVTSSPITGITFTIDGTPKTTPYTEWLLEGSYTFIMPETHNGYVWSHWLEDGDTNRTKTVTMETNIALTGVFFHIADLNQDGVVDMRDIALAAGAFGSYPSHPRWNPIADINQDNVVDMRDLATVARNFGKTA